MRLTVVTSQMTETGESRSPKRATIREEYSRVDEWTEAEKKEEVCKDQPDSLHEA